MTLLFGLSGCFGKNGDDPQHFADYQSTDGSFSLVYSNPPWREVSRKDRSLGLQIDAEFFGFSLGEEVPPTHVLIATTVSLDEHLKDLIDPKDFSKTLEKFGIDESQLPDPEDWNLSSIDTGALGTWKNNFSSGIPTNFSTDTDSDTDSETGTSSAGANQKPGKGKKKSDAQAEEEGPIDEIDPSKVAEQIPEYLRDVDLKNPRDVAVAELNYLVREQNARLVDGLQYFETDQGLRAVSYQLVIEPGAFVRNLYVPTQGNALRVGVMSMFNLTGHDFDRLLGSVFTNAVSENEQNAGKGQNQ